MKSRMPDNYEIPDDPDTGRLDAAYLRSCLGIRAKPGERPPALPASVRRAHYDMARSLSILGATGPAGMDPTQIATVIALALRDPDMEAQAKDEPVATTFMDEIEAGRAVHGQKVVVYFRSQECAAHYLGVIDDRISVLHDGNERKFQPRCVRHPKPDEFPKVPDNINLTAGV